MHCVFGLTLINSYKNYPNLSELIRIYHPKENKKRMSNIKPKLKNYSFSSLSCGADETRTRDPLRDRQVF